MGASAPRVCVINLGCRVNRVESDWMETSFVQSGASLCAEAEADIVAINTCAVTGEAQAKTRKAVPCRRFAHASARGRDGLRGKPVSRRA